MKKIIAIAITLVLTFCVVSAFAEVERISITEFKVEKYLETFEVQQTAYEICRANGDDYDNSAEPEPLLIPVENEHYVVHFRNGDPSDCSRWAARYFNVHEVIIVFEDTLEPCFQEVTVTKWYRFCDTKEDSGKTLTETKYLLTLPKDTRFE
jgi:hypothetical protein